MREQLLSLWPSETSVRACIKSEAEAIDEAVFLAVHQPMRFQRRDVGAGGSTVTRSESDLLDEFLTPNLPEGRLILPIVGNSGVGKSHVIRWIDSQLRRRPDAHQFHIIRVPKGSSLKGVLRLLLRDLAGETFDQLREALTTARDHLDPDRAARQLQLSLRFRLEREATAAKLRIAAGRAQASDEDLATFGDARMIPALLGDPLLEQQHWLARPNNGPGVLSLMAEQVTQEGRHDEDTRRHEFAVEDLLLGDHIDLGALSKQARDCYGKLHREDPTRRERATRVLNLVLDEAKNDLLQLGDNSLVEMFGEVRSALHVQNKELIFLVEDFAAVSGLQGSLLQVMIAEATRDGQQRLCTMRSALAYTEGYMAGRDTVLTRARSEWLLEDRPGNDTEICGRIEQLVGAYLNAARVGQARLRAAFGGGPDRDLRSWIPRMDVEGLEPPARAIIESFGRSADQYPLFPFNHAAIRQLARRGSVDSRQQLVFNPRHVINNILTRVLLERHAFERGEFPPAHVSDSLRSAEITAEVGRRVPRAALRQYLGILRLWGDEPETVADAAALPPEIFEAFDLSPLELEVPRVAQGSEGSDSGSAFAAKGASTTEASATQASIEAAAKEASERRWRELLESWGSGSALEQADARELRGWIHEAIRWFLPADALLYRPRLKARELIKKVYLPNSRGQAGLTPEAAFVVVANDDELADPLRSAALVRTLLAFARRYGVFETWEYDGAEVDGGLIHEFVEARASIALEYLRARHFQVEAMTLEPLVRGLLVGARALGVSGAHDRASLPELLGALLASDSATGPEGGPSAWSELVAALRAVRDQWRELLLEQVGARQGGANTVHAIDAAALAPLVALAKADWTFGSASPSSNSDPDYREFVGKFNDLKIRLERTIAVERRALEDWLPRAIDWFGESFDKPAIQAALRALVTDVKNRGLVQETDYERLRRELSDLPSLALVAARDAARKLAEEPDRGEVLSVLAHHPGRALGPAQEFIEHVEAFLAQVERALGGREAGIGTDVFEEAVRAVEHELESLGQLLNTREASGA